MRHATMSTTTKRKTPLASQRSGAKKPATPPAPAQPKSEPEPQPNLEGLSVIELAFEFVRRTWGLENTLECLRQHYGEIPEHSDLAQSAERRLETTRQALLNAIARTGRIVS